MLSDEYDKFIMIDVKPIPLLSNHFGNQNLVSLRAAGPRSCSRAAFSSYKMCYASFCLPLPSLGIEQKEARPQELIRKISSITLNWHFLCFKQGKDELSNGTIRYKAK